MPALALSMFAAIIGAASARIQQIVAKTAMELRHAAIPPAVWPAENRHHRVAEIADRPIMTAHVPAQLLARKIVQAPLMIVRAAPIEAV
jgi:hypothetical protein